MSLYSVSMFDDAHITQNYVPSWHGYFLNLYSQAKPPMLILVHEGAKLQNSSEGRSGRFLKANDHYMEGLKLALLFVDVQEPIVGHSLKIRGSATHHHLLISSPHNIPSQLSKYSVNVKQELAPITHLTQ